MMILFKTSMFFNAYSFSVFFCRVKLKEGVTFLGARPSNPTQWIVSQDVRSEGHQVVTLHCHRKESIYDQQRSAFKLPHIKTLIEILVNHKVNSFFI